MYSVTDCIDVVRDVQQFLERNFDVLDGSSGDPRPNIEMQLHKELERVRATLLKLKREGIK